MLQIGTFNIGSQTVLAPMAGISDLPFRSLCSKMGAGLVVNEMLTSDTRLWHSNKSQTRLSWGEATGPRVIQIAGSDPQQMANAASACVDLGAQIIDINMGCPAKKVCKKAAGSALLKDEDLVERILSEVISAVDVPVTLKIRTGWDKQNKNATTIANIAETTGIASLVIHGRTRDCRFKGHAEYDTIAEIVQQRSIPIIANGDIDSPQKAKDILEYTKAKAVMIGRAAQGNPWLFREINHFLRSGDILAPPTLEEVEGTMVSHLSALHDFYGDHLGVRIARKHISWYLAKQIQTIQGVDKHNPASEKSVGTQNSCEIALQGDEELLLKQSTYENTGLNDPLNHAGVLAWRKQFNTQLTKQKQINAVRTLFVRLQLLKDQAA